MIWHQILTTTIVGNEWKQHEELLSIFWDFGSKRAINKQRQVLFEVC